MTERFMIDDCGTLIDMHTRNTYDYVSDVVTLLNELNEEKEYYKSVINTIGKGILKINHTIKENKEDKALIMCLILLKKLEEENLLTDKEE